jgi:hypothetical protein
MFEQTFILNKENFFNMKTKPKRTDNYQTLYQHKFKPLILSYFQVPVEVTAEVLGVSSNTVQEMLRSGQYPFGIARKCKDSYRYEIMPLRLCTWIEGGVNNSDCLQNLSEGA